MWREAKKGMNIVIPEIIITGKNMRSDIRMRGPSVSNRF
jgi:hypothetical protein